MDHNHQPKDDELMDPKWFGIQTLPQLPRIPNPLFLPGKPSAGAPGHHQEVAVPGSRGRGSFFY